MEFLWRERTMEGSAKARVLGIPRTQLFIHDQAKVMEGSSQTLDLGIPRNSIVSEIKQKWCDGIMLLFGYANPVPESGGQDRPSLKVPSLTAIRTAFP